MVRFTGGLLLFSAVSLAAPTDSFSEILVSQQPLRSPQKPINSGRRKLQGKFLHITDIHPDPFYKVGSSPEGEHPCHRGSGKGSAGYYGAETTDCDTPFSLVNATFDWINDYVKDEVDFVVWTGDSARHDNDEQYPRSEGSVVDLNRFIVHKFIEVFGKTDNIDDPDPTNDFVIPIVPTFGNNDILPHNIFEPGPNKWTKKYEDIWRRFVPQEQRHSFARGGWFFTEVIPNKLAIFSLNTLYFFDSNSAVDGCDAKSEPGYEHMEWLRIQLQFLRERGMKAILIGHVPPARTESKQSWDETCYQKYTLWLRQYRDIILTTIYGHMNIDHFMFQDVKELKYKFLIDGVDEDFERANESAGGDTELEFTIAQKAVYLNELREGWADLPKPPKGSSYTNLDDGDVDMVRKKKKGKGDQMEDFLESIGGPYGERYSISLVSPSVVPNFFPTLRVVEYNITGLEDVSPAVGAIGKPATAGDILENFDFDSEEDVVVDADKKELEIEKKKKKKKGKKKSKRPNFHVPAPPSSTAPPGPAYSPQTLSLLSWKQYYANLTEIHENLMLNDIGSTSKSKDKHFMYQLEYQTNNDSWYQMQDLTVRSWLDVAEKLARAEYQKADAGEAEVEKKHKKKKKKEKDSSKEKNPVWRMWIARVFVMSKSDEELDDDF